MAAPTPSRFLSPTAGDICGRVGLPRSRSCTRQDGLGGGYHLTHAALCGSRPVPGYVRFVWHAFGAKIHSCSASAVWGFQDPFRQGRLPVNPVSSPCRQRHELCRVLRGGGTITRRSKSAWFGLALPSLRQAWLLDGLHRISPVPFRGSYFTAGLHPPVATPQRRMPCLYRSWGFRCPTAWPIARPRFVAHNEIRSTYRGRQWGESM